MNHLILLLYFVSFTLGIFILGMTFILYQQHRKENLFYFLIFIIGFTLDVFTLLIWEYYPITEKIDNSYYFYITELLNKGAGLLLIIGIPGFIHKILIIPINKYHKYLYGTLFIIQFILTLLYFIFKDKSIIEQFCKLPLFLTIIYLLILGIRNFKTIGNKVIRKALHWFIIVTVTELPILIINEYIVDVLPKWDIKIIHLLASPLFLIVISIIALFFTNLFFNQPSYISGNSLSDYFIETFNISKREKEIIILLLDGKNSNTIGETLFISPNTVKNHIASIYKKLEVKSRVQLLNFIKSNQE